MIRRPPRSTLDRSSAASDVYKRQLYEKSLRIDPTDAEWTQQVATCNGEQVPLASILGVLGGEVEGIGADGIVGAGASDASMAMELGVRAATEGGRKQARNGLWSALVADPTDLM